MPDDAWTNEALGVWNVRDLVGHTSRAILLVEEYATEGTTRSGFGTPDEIAERGRQAGQALGDDPVEGADARSRIVSSNSWNACRTTIRCTRRAACVRSRATSPTRVAELTIHTIDVANALGVDADPPPECVRATLYVLADYAVRAGTGT